MKIEGVIGLPVPGATGHGLILPTGQEADQANWVPVTDELTVTGAKDVPEQIDCPEVQEITGVGFTAQFKPTAGPEQPLA